MEIPEDLTLEMPEDLMREMCLPPARSASPSLPSKSGFEKRLARMTSPSPSFAGDFPPDMKGEMIGQQDTIREAHNSFARQDPFVSDEKKVATDDDDVFHFIAYVPHGGKVYELDGLKPGPVLLGDVPNGDNAGTGWLKVARARIQDRIQKYAGEQEEARGASREERTSEQLGFRSGEERTSEQLDFARNGERAVRSRLAHGSLTARPRPILQCDCDC